MRHCVWFILYLSSRERREKEKKRHVVLPLACLVRVNSCMIKQIVVVGWYFFCKCADSTSHYLAKQLRGLGKPIWPSSKFDSGNDDDEMKSERSLVSMARFSCSCNILIWTQEWNRILQMVLHIFSQARVLMEYFTLAWWQL